MGADIIRIGAVADVHYGRDTQARHRALFEQAAAKVDLLLIAGDLTDMGLPEEAEALAKDLAVLKGVPIAAVLGNHDYESGKEAEIAAVMRAAGVHMLDGESIELCGVGIVGAKGFGGGFGRGTLEPWGEAGVKRFVHESVEEALKLERALARLHTPRRIAMLHYAPIRDTVKGEPEEIFPFLGSGRLEEPINRYGVAAVIHGHAHHGAAEGKTSAGIPVYNVSFPLLHAANPDGLPLKILELPASDPAPESPKPNGKKELEGKREKEKVR
jgi:Icc-related predicted phosphoesterase